LTLSHGAALRGGHAIAAYTGDELDELLPDELNGYMKSFFIIDEKRVYGYMDEGEYPYEWPGFADHLSVTGDGVKSHMMADLAIKLLEQKIIKPSEFQYK